MYRLGKFQEPIRPAIFTIKGGQTWAKKAKTEKCGKKDLKELPKGEPTKCLTACLAYQDVLIEPTMSTMMGK